MSENKKELYKSLANFQQSVPVIHQGAKGYGYNYADLPTIFGIINPILKDNNLGFTQVIEGANMVTILFHTETGEELKTSIEIPQDVSLKGMNKFQVLGSAITYIRRYSISTLLGLCTDDDNDANPKQKPESKPTITPITDTSRQIKRIEACKDIESLKKVWLDFTPNEQANKYIISKKNSLYNALNKPKNDK